MKITCFLGRHKWRCSIVDIAVFGHGVDTNYLYDCTHCQKHTTKSLYAVAQSAYYTNHNTKPLSTMTVIHKLDKKEKE